MELRVNLTQLTVILGALLALGACNRHTSVSSTTSTEIKASETKATVRFGCVKTGGALCNYVVFTSNCTDGVGANGKPSKTCIHQVLEELSLHEGESKGFSDLPVDFKQCSAIGEKPQYPLCAK